MHTYHVPHLLESSPRTGLKMPLLQLKYFITKSWFLSTGKSILSTYVHEEHSIHTTTVYNQWLKSNIICADTRTFHCNIETMKWTKCVHSCWPLITHTLSRSSGMDQLLINAITITNNPSHYQMLILKQRLCWYGTFAGILQRPKVVCWITRQDDRCMGKVRRLSKE